jgi:hypothetical protein
MKCNRLVVYKNGTCAQAYSSKTRKAVLCNGNLKSSVFIDTQTDGSGAISYVNLVTNIKCDKCQLPYHDIPYVLEEMINKYLEEL